MSDWVYVIGEGSYNQDFIVIDHQTNEQIPLSGINTMFITKSDYTAAPQVPAAGLPLTIETNANGIQVLRLAVTATTMPNEADIYLAQIKLDASQTLKTFFLNLRVIRSITT